MVMVEEWSETARAPEYLKWMGEATPADWVRLTDLYREMFWYETRNWDGPDDIDIYQEYFDRWWLEPGGAMEQAIDELRGQSR